MLLAMWALVLACLSLEWLLPGSVSSLFPVFGSVSVLFVITLLSAPFFDLVRRAWLARVLGSLIVIKVIILLVFFAQRQNSSLIDYAVLACFFVGVGTMVGFFLPETV